MQKLLRLSSETKEYINRYYRNEKKEKNIIIYLKKLNSQYIDAEILVPQEDDYVCSQKKMVSLKPEYLLKCINKCIDSKYDGMFIMHNHVKHVLPIFSRTDRIMNKKLISFLDKYEINLIAGGIVYANGMITVNSNSKEINRRGGLIRI